MSTHNLFYHPRASLTNAQVLMPRVVAVWFDKLVISNPVDKESKGL